MWHEDNSCGLCIQRISRRRSWTVVPRVISAREVPKENSPKTQISNDAFPDGNTSGGQSTKLGKFARYSGAVEFWAERGSEVNRRDSAATRRKMARNRSPRCGGQISILVGKAKHENPPENKGTRVSTFKCVHQAR